MGRNSSNCPDPFDDGGEALSLFGVADLLHAAFEVAEHAVYLPRRLSFRHDLVRQLLGLVGLTEVEGCPKQRWTQPVVGQIQPLGALAGGDHQPQRSLRALFVACARTRSIKPRQVAGAIIGVEIELHAALIVVDRLGESLPAFPIRRGGLYEALVAPAQQAKTLGR